MAARTYTILVAEPNPAMQQVMKKIIADCSGANTVVAADPASAFQAAQKGGIDLALLDWSLAAPADFVLVKKIVEAAKNVPIMVMAPQVDQAKLPKLAQAGARHFIVKPFKPEALRRKFEEAGLVFDPPDAANGAQKAANNLTADHSSDPDADHQAKLMFAKGYEMLLQHKFSDAMVQFAKALKFQPVFPEAYKGIAESMKSKGDLAGSRQFLSKAAEAYVVLERNDAAKDIFHHLLKADPDTPNPFKTVAASYKANGDMERAMDCFEDALQLSPKDKEVATQLAEAAKESGDTAKAAKALETALALGGAEDNPELADLYKDLTGTDWFMDADLAEQKKLQVLEELEKTDYEEKRKDPRVPLADFFLRVHGVKEGLQVVNLSMGGVGFKDPDGRYKPGDTLTFDLVGHDKIKMKKLECAVRYNEHGMAGCKFTVLNKKQNDVLTKLLIQEKPIGFVLEGDVNFDIPMM